MSPDRSEILIGHLLRTNRQLGLQARKDANQWLKEYNDLMEENIQLLEGREPVHPARKTAKKAANDLGWLERIIQTSLEEEEFTEIHNQNHPEAPWATHESDLRYWCGDCAPKRFHYKRQLEQDAQLLR